MGSRLPFALLLLALPGSAGLQAQNAPRSAPTPEQGSAAWRLWGGPNRNFLSPSTGLAESWPVAGPPVLWKRDLGEGYSAIAVDGDTLYTMYHRIQPYWLIFSEQQEVVVALDARTGETQWEYPYKVTFRSAYADTGPGPHVMPQVVGNLVFTSGVTGMIHALDKKTGQRVWQRDLYEEFGGTRMNFGYSSHALPYKDNLIVMAGGEGKAILSLKQSSGEVVWARQSFRNAHSAPLLIDVDGEPQVAAVAADRIIGVNPDNGELLWSFPHTTEYGLAISLPVWGEDNLLFFSSSYGHGSRVLRLTREGPKTRVEEVWYSNRVRVHFGSIVRAGDTVYASSGHDGPAPLTAVDVPTGKILWQSREFAKASFVLAEGRLLVVDQEGHLGLATATPEGLTVHAKVLMLSPNAWTLPTLAGTRMYVRDRKVMMALDVGAK